MYPNNILLNCENKITNETPTRRKQEESPDLLNIKTITFFISVLKQDPEKQHAKRLFPCVDESKAIVTLPLDQESNIDGDSTQLRMMESV